MRNLKIAASAEQCFNIEPYWKIKQEQSNLVMWKLIKEPMGLLRHVL